ncbi:MAG: hypothetical protein ACLGHX_12180 [Acidimicrobiia bacterium]
MTEREILHSERVEAGRVTSHPACSISHAMGYGHSCSADSTARSGGSQTMSTMAQRRVAGATALMILFYVLQMLLQSPAAFAASVTPETTPGQVNPKCADLEGPGQTWLELKVDPNADGVYSDGTLTVTISNTTNDKSFDWSSNIGVDGVLVKGGNAGNHFYRYDPPNEVTGDQGLSTPDGKGDGISHISFCYDIEQAEPGEAALIVRKVVSAPEGIDAPDQDFTITVSGEEPVLLADGESSAPFIYEVAEGQTLDIESIIEALDGLDDNWTGVSVECTNGDSSQSHAIEDVTLTEGTTVTCTFTNVYTPDGTATVTVVKSVNQGAPSETFVFSATDKPGFNLPGPGQTQLVYEIPVEPGSVPVTIAEDLNELAAGWAFASVSCTEDNEPVGEVNNVTASASLVLVEGSDITCVFSNRHTATTTEVTTTTAAPTTTVPVTTATVLGTTIVAETTVPEVAAETLPFTGSASGDVARLGLLAVLAGVLMLFAVRGPKEEEGAAAEIGGWSSL